MSSFKLTKKEREQRDSLVADLEIASSALSAAVAAFNEALEAARNDLLPAVEAYNNVVENVQEFAEDIASSNRDKYDSRSDKWLESDAGSSANDFIEAWENIEFELVVLDLPDNLDELDVPHRDDLEELPGEADE